MEGRLPIGKLKSAAGSLILTNIMVLSKPKCSGNQPENTQKKVFSKNTGYQDQTVEE